MQLKTKPIIFNNDYYIFHTSEFTLSLTLYTAPYTNNISHLPISRGDGVGMTVGKSPDLAPRTSRRTNDYHDPWITRLVGDRLPEELMEKVQDPDRHNKVV